MIVWRALKQADDGRPEVGASMTTLGVRVRDLHPHLSGLVDPLEGGMSVFEEGSRLPMSAQTFLESGKGSVFALETDDLPSQLAYRLDPYNERHVFIEPASTMKFEIYQRFLQGTSDLWEPV